jgi:hypothetical protein
MSDATIFKTVDEYTVQPFKAYKEWTLTESTITQYSSSVNEALYLSASVIIDPYGSNASGLSKSSLFAAVYNAYYKYGWKPFDALGGNAQFQQRTITDRAVVVSIGNDYIGERIKPGSININYNATGSSPHIIDDGFGNLRDADVTGLVPSSSLVSHWNFNEGFITSGALVTVHENRNRVLGHTSLLAYGTYYSSSATTGLSSLHFVGHPSSYAIGDNERGFNFRGYEDFAVSLWVSVPTWQNYQVYPDNYIVNKWDGEGGYPFCVRILNNNTQSATDAPNIGKLYAGTFDSSGGVFLRTTNALTSSNSTFHHIVYQKHGVGYELWVDGVLDTYTTQSTIGQTHNNAPLSVGSGLQRTGTNEWTAWNPYTGAVRELRIYSGSLTSAQIQSLYTNPKNTDIVGNAFYAHGVLVFTNTSGSYRNIMCSGSEFVMNFKSTVTINEHTVMLTFTPSEYNMTFNPSAAKVISDRIMEYEQFVTGSEWSPYITTIGLYSKNHELVAVAKLAKPLKKPTDMPMTVAIRWDS